MAYMPNPFKLPRFLHAVHTKYALGCSEAEPVEMKELLDMADEESREMWNSLVLQYTHDAGHPLLRKEIAGLYKTLTADNVLLTTSMEGIFMGMSVLVPYLQA